MDWIEFHLKRPVARKLQKLGFSASVVTLTGMVICILVSTLLPLGVIPWLVGLLFLVGSFTDFFDGALARINPTPKNPRFGAWLDTIVDRITETAILTGIYFYLTGSNQRSLAFVGLITSLIVSFCKAAAGEKGIRLSWPEIGLLGYPGRVGIITLGLLLTALPIADGKTISTALVGLIIYNGISFADRVYKISRTDPKMTV